MRQVVVLAADRRPVELLEQPLAASRVQLFRIHQNKVPRIVRRLGMGTQGVDPTLPGFLLHRHTGDGGERLHIGTLDGALERLVAGYDRQITRTGGGRHNGQPGRGKQRHGGQERAKEHEQTGIRLPENGTTLQAAPLMSNDPSRGQLCNQIRRLTIDPSTQTRGEPLGSVRCRSHRATLSIVAARAWNARSRAPRVADAGSRHRAGVNCIARKGFPSPGPQGPPHGSPQRSRRDERRREVPWNETVSR